jgi:hypothetical protein
LKIEKLKIELKNGKTGNLTWSRPNQTGKGMGEEEAMPNQ